MKLRVNLYQADLQPRFDKMTLSQLGRAAMLVSVLLLLAAGLTYQQLSAVRTEQQLVQQQQQQKMQELEIYQQTLSNRQPSAQLQQQATLLQQSIAQKQQLLSYLQQESSKAPPRYAGVMQHLDAIDPTGLWLTGFSLGTIQRFDGIATAGELLPEWLKALGAAPGLQGLHFSSVKMEPVNAGSGENQSGGQSHGENYGQDYGQNYGQNYGKYRRFSVLASAPTATQLSQPLTELLQAEPAAVPVAAPLSPAAEAAAALKNNNSPGGQP